MRFKSHQLLALLAAFAVLCTPVFAGKVVCTTEAGHSAIEMAHESGGCPEDAETDHAPGKQSQPCEDRQLVGDLAAQAAKAGAVNADAACFMLCPIPVPLNVHDAAASLSTCIAACSLLPSQADRDRLTSTILLI